MSLAKSEAVSGHAVNIATIRFNTAQKLAQNNLHAIAEAKMHAVEDLMTVCAAPHAVSHRILRVM
jgi:hypothetical protein